MIRGTVTAENSPRAIARRMAEMTMLGFRESLEWWHAEVAPKHFEPQAVYLYNYQHRSIKHTNRKMRKYGHRNPLEFSGTTKRSMLGSMMLRSTKRWTEARMPVPRYFFMRPSARHPDKPAEATRLRDSEVENMARMTGRAVRRELANRREREEVRS